MKRLEQRVCPLGTWSFRARLGETMLTRTPPPPAPARPVAGADELARVWVEPDSFWTGPQRRGSREDSNSGLENTTRFTPASRSEQCTPTDRTVLNCSGQFHY